MVEAQEHGSQQSGNMAEAQERGAQTSQYKNHSSKLLSPNRGIRAVPPEPENRQRPGSRRAESQVARQNDRHRRGRLTKAESYLSDRGSQSKRERAYGETQAC